jgi:hypothetical protein
MTDNQEYTKDHYLADLANVDITKGHSLESFVNRWNLYKDLFTPDEKQKIANLANRYGQKATWTWDIAHAGKLQSLAQQPSKAVKPTVSYVQAPHDRPIPKQTSQIDWVNTIGLSLIVLFLFHCLFLYLEIDFLVSMVLAVIVACGLLLKKHKETYQPWKH